MANTEQYLRIEIAGTQYLLPSNASLAIEQRHNLEVNEKSGSPVAAWRVVRSVRWPAYAMDVELNVAATDDWQRAVFLDAKPFPVGLVANEIQLLPRTDLVVEPFTPLGKPPVAAGPLFNAAWVSDKNALLVFEPKALTAWLQSFGGAQ